MSDPVINPVEVEDKKPRHRSPNYPAVGLEKAVELVGKLWEKDGKAGAPPEIAAIHIGFAKPHGQAMSTLSALKKFGLVVESNGRLAPSQRAVEVINLPLEDPRRHKALQDAVVLPELYRELIANHQATGWPQADVLEKELVTYKDFNPKAVKGFVADLFGSLKYAGVTDLNALELDRKDDSDVPEVSETPVRGKLPPPPPPPPGARKPQQLASQVLAISIPRNLSVDVTVHGDELKKNDLAKIKSQFNRWIEGLEEAFEE